MAERAYALKQEEVVRAEIMAMRVIVTIVLKAFFDEHPRRDAVLQEIEDGVGQIVAQIPLEAVRRRAIRRFETPPLIGQSNCSQTSGSSCGSKANRTDGADAYFVSAISSIGRDISNRAAESVK